MTRCCPLRPTPRASSASPPPRHGPGALQQRDARHLRRRRALPPPAGWDFTSLTCSDPNDTTGAHGRDVATIRLQAGENITCTYTNTKRGKIIDRQERGRRQRHLRLRHARSAARPRPRLQHHHAARASALQQLAPGTYSVAEVIRPPRAGIHEPDLLTDDRPAPPRFRRAPHQPRRRRDRHLHLHQHPARLDQIVKNAVGGNGTFDYDSDPVLPAPANAAGEFSITTASGTGQALFSNVTPGTYAVDELPLPDGWDFTSLICSDPSDTTGAVDGRRPGHHQAAAGESVTCTYTNTKRGKIIVVKDHRARRLTPPQLRVRPRAARSGQRPGRVQHHRRSSARARRSSATWRPAPTPSVSPVDPCRLGLHRARPARTRTTRPAPPRVRRRATISLQAGENVTCTFTNTKRGSITIAKNAVGGNGTFNYDSDPVLPAPANALGEFSITTLRGTGQALFSNVAPGTYAVDELMPPPAGWDFTSLTCSDQTAHDRRLHGVRRRRHHHPPPGRRDGHLHVHQREARQDHRRQGDPASGSTQSSTSTPAGLTSSSPTRGRTARLLVADTYSVADPYHGWGAHERRLCRRRFAPASSGTPPPSASQAPGEIVTCTFTNAQRG